MKRIIDTLNKILIAVYPNKELPQTYKAFVRTLEMKHLLDDVELTMFFYGEEDCVREVLTRYDFRYQWTVEVDHHIETVVSLNDQKVEKLSEETHQETDDEIDMFFDFNDYIETDEFKQKMEKNTTQTTYRDNKELIDDYQHSDELAMRNDIIENNIGLVESLVNKYKWAVNTTSLTEEDLINYGVFGLMKAVDRFDVSHGTEFSTYAYHWIKQSIGRSIADEAYVIRIPVHMQDAMSKLNKLDFKFQDQPDKVAKICERMEISEEKYREILNFQNAYRHSDSLNRLMREGESDDEKLTLLAADQNIYSNEDEYFCSPEELTVKKIYGIEAMNLAESILTPREFDVLCYRFGKKTGQSETLEVVGEVFGVTRERIRQIEAKALNKIKNHIKLHGGL